MGIYKTPTPNIGLPTLPRLVDYHLPDDILVMHQSRVTLCFEVERMSDLPQPLGFTINYPTMPAQKIQFLGKFQLNEAVTSTRKIFLICARIIKEAFNCYDSQNFLITQKDDSSIPSSPI